MSAARDPEPIVDEHDDLEFADPADFPPSKDDD